MVELFRLLCYKPYQTLLHFYKFNMIQFHSAPFLCCTKSYVNIFLLGVDTTIPRSVLKSGKSSNDTAITIYCL